MQAGACLVWLLVLACRPDKDDAAETTGVASTSTNVTSISTEITSTTIAATSSASGAPTTTSSANTTAGDPPLPSPDALFCPLDWAEPTTITGTTPFGQFAGSVAWFEWQYCNGYYPIVLVVEDAAEVADYLATKAPIARAVAFSLPTAGWEALALTGEFQPTVYALVEGQWTDMNLSQGAASVSASVSVADTAAPDAVPRIVGQFSLQGGQGAWDLSGSFAAAYCGPLNDFKPINCD